MTCIKLSSRFIWLGKGHQRWTFSSGNSRRQNYLSQLRLGYSHTRNGLVMRGSDSSIFRTNDRDETDKAAFESSPRDECLVILVSHVRVLQFKHSVRAKVKDCIVLSSLIKSYNKIGLGVENNETAISGGLLERPINRMDWGLRSLQGRGLLGKTVPVHYWCVLSYWGRVKICKLVTF